MTSRLQHQPSRRGFCLCCLAAPALAATGVWLTPQQAYAEALSIVEMIRSEAAKAPITTHQLRGNVTVLEGSGGNIAVLTTADGKLLVDAGINVSQRQISAALAVLGPQPVTHVVNTHWHFDHASGNEWLSSLSPRIIAHENTRKHLAMTQRVEDWNYDFAPLSAAALPTELFSQEHTVALKGNTIALSHYGAAHTDSDIAVHFVEADILHAGDTFWNGVYPFIDYSTGGSIDGSIRAAEANLAATTDGTVVIPGHGQPVSNRAELAGFPRHAGRHPRQGCRAEAARHDGRGDRRGQADRRMGCQMGWLRHRPGALHPACGCGCLTCSCFYMEPFRSGRRAMRDHGRMFGRAVAWGILLAAASMTIAPAAEVGMADIKRLTSTYPFAETLRKIRTALEDKGFTVFALIDQREAARSVGLDMPPTTLLVYGNPKGGTPPMLAAPDFGIELPLKLLVREETGGKVLVVYVPAAALEGRHGLPAGLATKPAGAEPSIAAAIGAHPD
ncbi:MBL fold metallo-hydrolase [Dankookia sp. P2]|uniref:MBL fold metallo-hydrolase n=1 Tax=Dankookia sp. P2 TaxID=3423955 RepID=UPI003D66D2F8